MNRFFPLLLVAISISSCGVFEPEPKPTADFVVTVLDNGLVRLDVSSSNADSFDWDFGNGEKGTGKNIQFRYDRNGQYVITLTAKGKGGEISVQQRVEINDVKGTAMFWMSRTERTIRVTLNNRQANITAYYSNGAPSNCGASGTATFTALPEGRYNFIATEVGTLFPTTWNGTITITGGDCSKMQLTY